LVVRCKYPGTLEELDLGQVVEQAKDVMGLNGTNKVFSTDILRVEVSGPRCSAPTSFV
jgi:hypothetical protein